MDVHVAELRTFEVDSGGTHARLHFRDVSGCDGRLLLPVARLQELLMTLPRMVQLALRRRSGDASLRLVYPLDDFRLELGEPTADGVPRVILTLATTGGFAVSFSARHCELLTLAEVIANSELCSARSSIC